MSIKVTKKSGIQQDGNIVQQLLFRYLPYWPLFVVMLVLGVATAYVYIRYAIPVYQAKASILIKDEKKGTAESKMLEQINVFGTNKIVENEIEMIRSRALLKNVVKNLKLYAPVYEEGKINIVPAFTKSPVELEVSNMDSLVSVSRIFFSYDKNKQIVTVNGKQFPLNQWVQTEYGSPWKFTENPYYEKWHTTKSMFFQLIEPKYVIDYLDEQLSVAAPNKQATVLDLKVKDPVPVRGKLILNELIRQYTMAAVSDKNELALNTLKFVEQNLSATKAELDSIDRAIQTFKTVQDVVDIGVQGQQYLAASGTSDAKLSDIDVQLSALKEVESYVRSKGQGAGIVPSTLGLNDPLLSGLLTKLYDAEAQYQKLITTTGENNPMAVQLRQQIEGLRPSILDNIASQKRNLTASRSTLASSGSKYSSLLRAMPEQERQLTFISRDREVKAAQYQALLQKKAETELSLKASVSDSRIVDEAEASSEPVSPNILFAYLVSVMSGLGIAVLIIALKEGFNRTILFRSEIENYTSVPVIGEVIHDASGQPIVISHDRKNFIAEQFRQIRTSLSYLGISSKKKKILITSSIPGEGKSFVAANLAISLALTDKKVVLLEVDLRKPKLSEIFGMQSSVNGISNYLIGEKEADEIIRRTEVNPNLFIISAGPIPPNPSELILNGRIQELLVYLENAFDFIVIDTAPVSPVTDAYLLSQFCDATLYVVRHAYTPRIYLQLLDENNRVRGLKNLALIFNGVKARGIGKGGYGNGYGYGYGVGYDDVDTKSGARKSKLFGKAYR
ncbi:MAG: polysaccharide biosynthesis tyrosine autokinase [Chitinophagaceae bacterium]|nr:polysaccharide biosynthesis tyrosine autokinase [Chitinophagaceae bacterium]